MKERRVEIGNEQGGSLGSSLEVKEREGVSLRGLWIGCGDFTHRSFEAIRQLRELGVEMTFIDVRQPGELKADPTAENFAYFNVMDASEGEHFTQVAQREHFDVVFVANYPELHVLSASEHARTCDGILLLTKPIDSNFELLHTIKKGWPPQWLDRLYVHDHYLNKAGVEAFRDVLPHLVRRCGRPTQIRAFLVEPRTVEEEDRIDALQCGVSLDLLWHLLAITQVYFPTERKEMPQEAFYRYQPLAVEEVLKGQYRHSALSETAETFAVVNAVIPQEFIGHGRRVRRDVQAQFIVGKGIRVDRDDPGRSLKAFQITFQGPTVTLNIKEHAIGPLPPVFETRIDEFPQESGFFRPLLEGISGCDQKELLRKHFMTFQQAYEVACLLERVHIQGSLRPMSAYNQHEELGSVFNDCAPLLTRGLELPADRQIADILAIK